MAMDPSDMANYIRDKINAVAPENRNFENMWYAIAEGIISFLQDNATIQITGTATGVTAGAASVPVTGSGTIV